MTATAIRELGAALVSEWAQISSERRSRDRLRAWAEGEPSLDGLASLQEVADAIAVPLGRSQEESIAITQAVIRLAAVEPMARRLLLQVMVPIAMKECFRTVDVVRMSRVSIDDAEIASVVLGATDDAIASVAGTTIDYPLRNLHRRMVKRLVRRREKLITQAREVLEYVAQDQPAAVVEASPAELLADTLTLAIERGIVSAGDARLMWASSHEDETSFSLAQGDRREAERLRRRRSRAKQRLAAHRSELAEVIAV